MKLIDLLLGRNSSNRSRKQGRFSPTSRNEVAVPEPQAAPALVGIRTPLLPAPNVVNGVIQSPTASGAAPEIPRYAPTKLPRSAAVNVPTASLEDIHSFDLSIGADNGYTVSANYATGAIYMHKGGSAVVLGRIYTPAVGVQREGGGFVRPTNEQYQQIEQAAADRLQVEPGEMVPARWLQAQASVVREVPALIFPDGPHITRLNEFTIKRNNVTHTGRITYDAQERRGYAEVDGVKTRYDLGPANPSAEKLAKYLKANPEGTVDELAIGLLKDHYFISGDEHVDFDRIQSFVNWENFVGGAPNPLAPIAAEVGEHVLSM